MDTNERFKWLLEATPKQLAEYDALRAGQKADPPSLKLCRPGAAAKLLGLSRASVWRAVVAGTIKTVQLRKGGVRLIPGSELERLVAVRQ